MVVQVFSFMQINKCSFNLADMNSNATKGAAAVLPVSEIPDRVLRFHGKLKRLKACINKVNSLNKTE